MATYTISRSILKKKHSEWNGNVVESTPVTPNNASVSMDDLLKLVAVILCKLPAES